MQMKLLALAVEIHPAGHGHLPTIGKHLHRGTVSNDRDRVRVPLTQRCHRHLITLMIRIH